MVVEFFDRALFGIQHQVSSIQHLLLISNGLKYSGQARWQELMHC